MPENLLTHQEVENLKPKAKPYRESDGGGLSIEVTSNNTKLWRFRYRYNGREQIMSLGKFPISRA